MHTHSMSCLLTVKACGGSTALITILNRLGVVSSVDTLKRHVHTISQIRRDEGLNNLLVKDAFTIASTDNIDFLQSHASVYSGSQHRSWHATSIQLVQPRPTTCKLQYQESHSTVGLSVPYHLAAQVSEANHTSTLAESSSYSSTEPHCDVSAHLHLVASVSPEPSDMHDLLHASLDRKRKERSSPFGSPQ